MPLGTHSASTRQKETSDLGADISLAPFENGSFGTPCMQQTAQNIRDAQSNQIAVSGEVLLTLDVLGPSGNIVEVRLGLQATLWRCVKNFFWDPVQQPILCLGKFFRDGWSLSPTAVSKLALSKEDVSIDVQYKQNS